jgi:hypothetical protein
MKIDIRDNIEPTLALELVKRVIERGKISQGEKGKMYYCWVTEFEVDNEVLVVSTRQYRKDDCFAVYKR